MNMIGYDAMALGEGDLARLGLDVLRQRIQEAHFAILSANAYLAESGERLAQPYLIREVDGHRIAVIGLTGQATVPGVEIRDPLESARQAVAGLEGQADIVILLSHAGQKANVQIANELPAIDLVISGGGDQFIGAPQWTQDGRVVLHVDKPSSGHAGRWIGVGTWSFDDQGQPLKPGWQSIALTPDIPDDPEVAQWVRAHP